ncbi:MAG: response regulator transcription factor, partial [Gammaproteobacteria bacterium]|nr:response regulator transcription factor [Gammaproteobacteria bacterium]
AREERESTRILVIDDDPRTLRFVRDALSRAGFAPLVTGDPLSLPRLIRTEKPALVLLDLMLPGGDGIELMEQLPDLSELPVIFISGYNRDETMARALEAGAADYIVKPFSTTELVARVQAALRQRAEPERFALFDLEIRYEERLATLAGAPMPLTTTEFDLLRALSLNAGRVATYDILLRQVWVGRKHANEQLVRTFVKKLRHKLGDPAGNP